MECDSETCKADLAITQAKAACDKHKINFRLMLVLVALVIGGFGSSIPFVVASAQTETIITQHHELIKKNTAAVDELTVKFDQKFSELHRDLESKDRRQEAMFQRIMDKLEE